MNTLWMFAPTAIMVGAVWLWRLQVSREFKRRSFEGKLLGPRIEVPDEQLMSQPHFANMASSLTTTANLDTILNAAAQYSYACPRF
jgi:hypothetical protein